MNSNLTLCSRIYFVTITVPSNYKLFNGTYYPKLSPDEQRRHLFDALGDWSFACKVFEMTKKTPRIHLHGLIWLNTDQLYAFRNSVKVFETRGYKILSGKNPILKMDPINTKREVNECVKYMNKDQEDKVSFPFEDYGEFF